MHKRLLLLLLLQVPPLLLLQLILVVLLQLLRSRSCRQRCGKWCSGRCRRPLGSLWVHVTR